VLLFPNLGRAPLERAEIYFMDGARAMVEGGDWLVPRYRGQPFFDKPPLTYWLMAVSMLWLGPSPAAARLVSALAALAVLAVTLALGRLLFDRCTALTGGLVLASTLAFVGFGRMAMSDMLLTLWSTLAVALAVSALAREPPVWALPALGAILGLGFASKGPIAILLPGLAILLWWWPRQREGLRLPAGRLALAAVLLAVTGLGWFVLVYLRMGARPLEYFFLRENLERFAGETYDSGHPPWFYLTTYLAEGLPWSLFLPLALWRMGRSPGESGVRFLAAWVGLMLVPLSLSRGKIDYYLLPLYPALSLILGRFFAAEKWSGRERAWARGAVLLVAAGAGLLAAAPLRLPLEWLPGPGPRLALRLLAAAGSLACAWVGLRDPSPRRVAGVLAASVGLVFLPLVAWFLPAFASGQPNLRIAAEVERETRWRPDARLLLCRDPSRAQRDVLFHARVAVEERCDLWPRAASREPYLMLLGPEERASFRTIPGYREVGVHRYLPATVFTFEGLLLERPVPGEVVLAANYATADPEAERKRRKEYRRMLRREEAATASPGR